MNSVQDRRHFATKAGDLESKAPARTWSTASAAEVIYMVRNRRGSTAWHASQAYRGLAQPRCATHR